LHDDLVKAEGAGEVRRNAGAADISDDSNKPPGRSGDVPPKKRHKRNASNEGKARIDMPDENPSIRNVHKIANESSESSSETGEEDPTDVKEDDSANYENLIELRSQWDSLLDERQEMDSKDDISAWLDRVVETSELFKKASRRSKKEGKRNNVKS
jgi:hypothetical protein